VNTSNPTPIPAQPKRGRPVLTAEARARRDDRIFMKEIIAMVVESQQESARAQKELSIAIQGWMKMMTVNTTATAAASWTNTDTSEWVREQAARLGKADEVPVGSEVEMVDWLAKEMEKEG
jgi:hypothetical protein